MNGHILIYNIYNFYCSIYCSIYFILFYMCGRLNANIRHDVMSHWYNLYCQKCINVHNPVEHAVIKLMHVQLQSCTMNANDANTVKFLVLQSQNHVNLDRQTGQLPPIMSVKMSLYAAQNVVCLYGTKAMPERSRSCTHSSSSSENPNSVLYFPGPAFFSPSNSSPHKSAIFHFRHFPHEQQTEIYEI